MLLTKVFKNSQVHDSGKPIWEARVDILSVADALEYYGGLAPAINGQYLVFFFFPQTQSLTRYIFQLIFQIKQI